MLGVSLSPCHRFHPAEVEQPRRSDFGCPCCLRPSVAGSAFGAFHFRGHIRVHFRYGPVTRTFPSEDLSIGFRASVSLLPAIQATGLLISAPAGLSPAEHASPRWTHNRTCGFPASGSRTRPHAFAHGRSRVPMTMVKQPSARTRLQRSWPSRNHPLRPLPAGGFLEQCTVRVLPSLPHGMHFATPEITRVF